MRIGVVCEGPTDYLAIRYFIGQALKQKGYDVDFVDLQPDMDATQLQAGWGNVERWLNQTTPLQRCKRYFTGGLFESELDTKACDLMIIQMDCDHIGEASFKKFNAEKYGIGFPESDDISHEWDFAESILNIWCGLANLTAVDVRRHIVSPAQQSTESWCIAAVRNGRENPDALRGQAMIDEFMRILHESEGRIFQRGSFAEVDKSVRRRRAFCEKNAPKCYPAIEASVSFRKAVERLVSAV